MADAHPLLLTPENLPAILDAAKKVTSLVKALRLLGYSDKLAKRLTANLKALLIQAKFDAPWFQGSINTGGNARIDTRAIQATLANKESLALLREEAVSLSDLCVLLNIPNSASDLRKLTVEYLAIHQLPPFPQVKNRQLTMEMVFCANSTVQTSVARSWVLKNDLIKYACRKCPGGAIWNGRPITLHLEHKNGDPTDHRLGNLEFLCPNCHSQTLTFSKPRSKRSGRSH